MSPLRTARPRFQVAAVGVLVLVLAACGSNLDPQKVADAQGGGGGSSVSSSGGGGTTTNADGTITVTGPDGTTTNEGGTTTNEGGGTTTEGGTTTNEGGGTTEEGGGDTPDGGAPTTPPVEAPSAAECEGLQNQVGITDDTITIGNSSDITGPVPGLFATAQDATTAFVDYFNKAVPAGICGRKLKLINYDSRTDASGDQEQYVKACKEVFAMVGSVSAYDSGGASTAQGCNLPDLRGGSITQVRNDCTTCFGVQAVNTSFFEKAVPKFVISQVGAADAQKAAFFYTNQGAAAENAQAQVRAMTKDGLKFPIVQGIEATEFNYSSYVSALKAQDIKVVFFTTAYNISVRMRQAMQQQGYTPKLYLRDPTDYNPAYVSTGGSAVNGTVIYSNFAMFTENNPEMQLYRQSLEASKPGTPPLFFGVFAWSAARLFVTLAAELGGKLTRQTLIDAVKKQNAWTGNGMHAPQPVGSRGTGECWRFIKLNGTNWEPVGSTKYTCAGVTSTN